MAREQTVGVAADRAMPASGVNGWIARFANDNGPFLVTLVLIIVIWEAAVRILQVSTLILPAPSAIVEAMAGRWRILLVHTGWTLSEVIMGFLLGVVVGVPLAVAIVYSNVIEKTIYAFLVSSQAIPKVALAPLLIAWFGFSQPPKILVVFLICFFPIVISTVLGLQSMPVEMFHLARTLGASGWETFWKFRLPIGLPSIFGGLKVAISLAVIGAVVGEYVAGNNGLGYYQEIMGANLQTATVFAVLVLLSLIGLLLFYVVSAIEGWVVRWAPSQQIEQATQI